MIFMIALTQKERRMLVNALSCKVENLLQNPTEPLFQETVDDWVRLIAKVAQLPPAQKVKGERR